MKVEEVITSLKLPWATRGELKDEKGVNTLIDLVKSNASDIGEIVHAAPRKTQTEVFTLLSRRLTQVLDSEEASGADPTQETLHAVKYLHAAATLCLKFIEHEPESFPVLFDCIFSLHNSLLTMECEDALILRTQMVIYSLLEKYFLDKRDGYENITPQLLTFLVYRCVGANPDEADKKMIAQADIKRLVTLRETLTFIDFDADDSVWLRENFVRLVLKRGVVTSLDGRKLMSSLFMLSSEFTKMLHQHITAKFGSLTQAELCCWGDVYYKTWAALTEQCTVLERLEKEKKEKKKGKKDDDEKKDEPAVKPNPNAPHLMDMLVKCLEHLVELSILSGHAKVSTACRTVLNNGFYSQKYRAVKGRAKLMVTLTDGLIWRAATCTNSTVRLNALHCLLDGFPLVDEDADSKANEQRLARQYELFDSMLLDDVPSVREKAVGEVCALLSRQWSSLPEQFTRTTCFAVVKHLAFDSASINVRVEAIKALTTLMTETLSHPLLKILLPHLAPLIHDKSDKVQLALLQLLLQVRSYKLLKFYEIVPVDELMLRMQESNVPYVHAYITQLFAKSYFPHDKSNTEQVNRVLGLLKTYPNAGRVMCMYLSGYHTNTTSTTTRDDEKKADDEEVSGVGGADYDGPMKIKLIVMLYRTVLFNVSYLSALNEYNTKQANAHTRTGRTPSGDEEEEEEVEVVLKAPTPPSEELLLTEAEIELVLTVMSSMWSSITDYQHNEGLQDTAVNYFKNGGLEQVLHVFPDNETIRTCVLQLAAKLTEECVPQLANTLLRTSQDSAQSVQSVVSCLSSWGKQDSLLLECLVSVATHAVTFQPSLARAVVDLIGAANCGVLVSIQQQSLAFTKDNTSLTPIDPLNINTALAVFSFGCTDLTVVKRLSQGSVGKTLMKVFDLFVSTYIARINTHTELHHEYTEILVAYGKAIVQLLSSKSTMMTSMIEDEGVDAEVTRSAVWTTERVHVAQYLLSLSQLGKVATTLVTTIGAGVVDLVSESNENDDDDVDVAALTSRNSSSSSSRKSSKRARHASSSSALTIPPSLYSHVDALVSILSLFSDLCALNLVSPQFPLPLLSACASFVQGMYLLHPTHTFTLNMLFKRVNEVLVRATYHSCVLAVVPPPINLTVEMLPVGGLSLTKVMTNNVVAKTHACLCACGEHVPTYASIDSPTWSCVLSLIRTILIIGHFDTLLHTGALMQQFLDNVLKVPKLKAHITAITNVLIDAIMQLVLLSHQEYEVAPMHVVAIPKVMLHPSLNTLKQTETFNPAIEDISLVVHTPVYQCDYDSLVYMSLSVLRVPIFNGANPLFSDWSCTVLKAIIKNMSFALNLQDALTAYINGNYAVDVVSLSEAASLTGTTWRSGMVNAQDLSKAAFVKESVESGSIVQPVKNKKGKTPAKPKSSSAVDVDVDVVHNKTVLPRVVLSYLCCQALTQMVITLDLTTASKPKSSALSVIKTCMVALIDRLNDTLSSSPSQDTGVSAESCRTLKNRLEDSDAVIAQLDEKIKDASTK